MKKIKTFSFTILPICLSFLTACGSKPIDASISIDGGNKIILSRIDDEPGFSEVYKLENQSFSKGNIISFFYKDNNITTYVEPLSGENNIDNECKIKNNADNVSLIFKVVSDTKYIAYVGGYIIPANDILIDGPHNVTIGETITLNATASPNGSLLPEEITWTVTSGASYVYLPEIKTGNSITIKGVNEGVATIKAQSGDISKTIDIEVCPITYQVSIPTFVGGKISTDKQKYKPNEEVHLLVEPDDGYFLTHNSLKYDNVLVGTSYSFTMPEKEVTISANFKKDDIPNNQIYGARFTGAHLPWNMAMIHTDEVALENVQGLIVEVRFNKMIENFWMRLACATTDGTIYDAFGTNSSSVFYYSCDMDHPNATDQYNWATTAWGGWCPSWDLNYDPIPPTYYIEVPINYLFARFNLNGQMCVPVGTSLSVDKVLSQLGIHITYDSNDVDFTIGKLYIRQNNIVKQISSPYTYSQTTVKGFNQAEIYKIDDWGVKPSSGVVTVYENVKKPTKKALMMGDSIMTRWWTNEQVKRIADTLDLELVRDTIGGTTISNCYYPNRDNSIIEHLNNGLYEEYIKLYSDFDLIIIERGTNDLWNYVNNIVGMGTPTSTSEETNTIMGSLRKALEYFKTKCPNAKIVVSSPLYRHDEISDDVVREYKTNLEGLLQNVGGINYFDLYSNSGINESNYELYLNSSTHPHHNGSPADNLHPNDDGAIILGNAWINYLKSLLKE